MKLQRSLCAATLALALASFAAQATVYTYTGNTLTHDTDSQHVFSDPSVNITAWFDIDRSTPSPDTGTDYTIVNWQVRAGPVQITPGWASYLESQFSFDTTGNIVDWYFRADFVNEHVYWDPYTGEQYVSGAIQSISSYSANAFGPGTGPYEYAYEEGSDDNSQWYYDAVDLSGNQGSWTPHADVPEPASLALLGLGGAAFAGARRRRQPGSRAGR
jgi:hypothetical protein